jgi:hypothetical protein
MPFLSALTRSAYSEGGFYDEELSFNAEGDNNISELDCIRNTIISENSYGRPPPLLVSGPDEHFNQTLNAYYEENGRKFSNLPPVALVSLQQAALSGNEIFITNCGQFKHFAQMTDPLHGPSTLPQLRMHPLIMN